MNAIWSWMRCWRSCSAASQPPLVVEDVHWADEATVDTLRFLVRRIAQLPVVLLLTYR